MSGPDAPQWSTTWDVERKPFARVISDQASAAWNEGLRAYLRYRDLGLDEASGGMATAKHIRVVGEAPSKAESEWHCHDLDFQFFFVRRGSITIETADTGVVTIGRFCSAYQPPLYFHREYEATDDLESIEIMVPASIQTITGRDSELPPRAADLDPKRRPVQTKASDLAVPHSGSSGTFWIRDLGTAEPTGGRIRMRYVWTEGGADASAVVMGSRWLFVVDGAGEIVLDDGPPIALDAGESCAWGGTEVSVCVRALTDGFSYLEMATPAPEEAEIL